MLAIAYVTSSLSALIAGLVATMAEAPQILVPTAMSEPIFDGTSNTLGVARYSKSYNGKISWEELRPHLVTNKRIPNAYMFHCMWQYRPWDADWSMSVPYNKYSKFGPAEPMIIHPHKTEEGMMMSMMMGDSSNRPPLPNGRPSLKDASEYFESLKKSIPGVHLEEVLLAINNNSQNDLAKGYEALITNPIYQLK